MCLLAQSHFNYPDKLTCKVVKSYGGKSSDKNSFLFLLSSQKLRLDDVSIWQKFPLVNRKECKCPTWGSKPRPTSHQTKFTSKSLFQIWYFNFFSQMNILAINVRWKLSTLWKLVTKSWQMKLECVKKFEGRLQYLILFGFSENLSKRKYLPTVRQLENQMCLMLIGCNDWANQLESNGKSSLLSYCQPKARLKPHKDIHFLGFSRCQQACKVSK